MTNEESDIEYALILVSSADKWAEIHSRGGDLRDLLKRIAKAAKRRLKPGKVSPSRQRA